MLSNSNPNIVNELEQYRHHIYSKTGGWLLGRGVYTHGYSLLEELIDNKSYFQVMILNATGKLVERALADWVEATYICLSWPDPRIWCNQIGALAGVAHTSAAAATAMGSLASDSLAYGGQTLLSGIKFIQSAFSKYSQGIEVVDIVNAEIKKHLGKPKITGYIRPLAKGDERLEAMERVSKHLKFDEGEHLKLAYLINEELQKKFNESMNINGYVSAFLSDHGFSAQEAYQIYSMVVMSGVTACYAEQVNKEPDSFLPLRCDDIQYNGKAYRTITTETPL